MPFLLTSATLHRERAASVAAHKPPYGDASAGPSPPSMLCNKGAMAPRERVGKGIDKVSSGRLDTTKATGHTSGREEIP